MYLRWALEPMTSILGEHRREAHVKTEAENGVTQSQPRNTSSHQEQEEARKGSLIKLPGAQPCRHLYFGRP